MELSTVHLLTALYSWLYTLDSDMHSTRQLIYRVSKLQEHLPIYWNRTLQDEVSRVSKPHVSAAGSVFNNRQRSNIVTKKHDSL